MSISNVSWTSVNLKKNKVNSHSFLVGNIIKEISGEFSKLEFLYPSLLDIKQLYHVASSKRNRKGEITQLEFLGSSKAKALLLRRMEILYSSSGAGSTCKHLRNILL